VVANSRYRVAVPFALSWWVDLQDPAFALAYDQELNTMVVTMPALCHGEPEVNTAAVVLRRPGEAFYGIFVDQGDVLSNDGKRVEQIRGLLSHSIRQMIDRQALTTGDPTLVFDVAPLPEDPRVAARAAAEAAMRELLRQLLQACGVQQGPARIEFVWPEH
jgi:hypothetical protein